jgi:hypothetical protein
VSAVSKLDGAVFPKAAVVEDAAQNLTSVKTANSHLQKLLQTGKDSLWKGGLGDAVTNYLATLKSWRRIFKQSGGTVEVKARNTLSTQITTQERGLITFMNFAITLKFKLPNGKSFEFPKTYAKYSKKLEVKRAATLKYVGAFCINLPAGTLGTKPALLGTNLVVKSLDVRK